jgi:O-antigen ligase
MTRLDLAPAGGALAAVGLAFVIAARGGNVRLGGLGLVALGSILLAVPLVPAGHVAYVIGACVVAAVVSGGIALALRRWPWALAFATLALVPARIPIHVGHSHSKLLLPLYLLAGGAAIQLAIELVQGDERSRELGLLSVPLAAFILWTGLSLTWSGDVREGTTEFFAFYVPFALIAVGISRLEWSRGAMSWLAAELAAMALLFAGIGFWQYRTRNLLIENPKLVVGNAYQGFFRVNSVFWDPSVYGRFLMVAIVVGVVVVLRGRSLRDAGIAAALVVVLWLGLLLSFSQSSFAGLAAAVFVAAAVAWRWRAMMAIGLAAVVLVSAGVASPHIRTVFVKHTKSSLNQSTSGRASLVNQGMRIAFANPILGVGVGDFKHAYAQRTHLKGRQPKKAASHNTPVTVAAEGGVVGLALFLWLVGAAIVATFRRLGRSFEHRAALAVGLMLIAVFVHSCFYNDFFEDPMTWGLLALAALAGASLERPKEAV